MNLFPRPEFQTKNSSMSRQATLRDERILPVNMNPSLSKMRRGGFMNCQPNMTNAASHSGRPIQIGHVARPEPL